MQVRRSLSHSGAVRAPPLGAALGIAEVGAESWLQQVLQPFAVSLRLPAQAELDAEAVATPCYYLVVSGELLVRRQQSSSKPVVRFMTAGDLFSLDGGAHPTRSSPGALSCNAIYDSVVWRIERRQLEPLAQDHPSLGQILRSVAASELEMLQHCPYREPLLAQPAASSDPWGKLRLQ